MRYSEANVFSTRGWQSPVCRVPHELTRYTPSEFLPKLQARCPAVVGATVMAEPA